ncbi:Sds3-like-domain-containing protein [Pseudoneurospora amorphoporcata]|uniref:Sds3-like-domain-containing protein n=1 Tax=Pseudoneurospora amorphoporcata TaxID=241081 RepID=A0AAN6NW57_9PEZI|nr:Sds3-like-domain-containing protein [Pseudoneurospora amorphoporcata]
MATGDTALSLALSSPPPPLLQHSPSDVSSPLSDVEDKHGDPDDMDLDMNSNHSQHREASFRTDNRDATDSDLGAETDDESKLSDVDINDSEAETERLYDTPPKDRVSHDIVDTEGEPGTRQFTDRRDRTFERSPSKLQQQIKADYEPENTASGRNTPSEEAEEGDEDASEELSEEEPEEPESAAELPPSRSPVLAKKVQAVSASTETVLTLSSRHDTLKRKRSSIAEQQGLSQPPKKRADSNTSPEELSADDVPVVDIEVISTNSGSGNQSAEEDNNGEPVTTAGADSAAKDETEPAEAIEEDATDGRTKKGKRGAAKKRKIPTPDVPGGDDVEETNADASADADVVAVEDSGAQAEEDPIDDVDEEAEAAHRNEEELERKKSAWEELTAIERNFSSFRERLYQERLELLNQEEAMLTCENPTHPEYLAMLQCLNSRREERIKTSTLELQFRMAMLQRRAVAERAQILSHYHQAVRESREKVLEELGQEWYDIQQERRRFANAIPDYGIHYPTAKTQSIRNAVAYNKEVSILSGFAKHVGFPAAPPIHGASEDQVENDLEAIARSREPAPRPIPNYPPAFHQEYSSAGLPFGRTPLGPAGEQFIEQTPWANPNHPAHQMQRQQLHHEVPFAGPPSGPRHHSQQPMAPYTTNGFVAVNGDGHPVHMQKGHASGAHEPVKSGKLGPEQAMKREGVPQAS